MNHLFIECLCLDNGISFDSINMAGSISCLTSTIVAAGRILAKYSPWRGQWLPLGDVGDEHACADNIAELSAGLSESSLNVLNGLNGLGVSIACA